MKDNRTITRLFWTIAGAVALIALGSFVWSFFALWELAEQNSTQTGLGWIWPLIVDLSMVIYTAAIMVAQLQRRPAKLPIALTVFYSLVTIAGNVLHAPTTPLGWFVAILPPLSLVFGTEMLRTMGHHIIERSAAVATLAELSARRDTLLSDVAQLVSAHEAATAKLETVKAELKAVQHAQMTPNIEQMNAKRQAIVEERRAKVLEMWQLEMTPADISAALSVSLSTIRRDLGALNGHKVRQ